MKKTSKAQETKYGICQVCGNHVALPCEQCQAEALRCWEHMRQSDSLKQPVVDFSIRLETPEMQRSYEAVREFRDKHGYPMFSEQWRKQLTAQLCHTSNEYQEIF